MIDRKLFSKLIQASVSSLEFSSCKIFYLFIKIEMTLKMFDYETNIFILTHCTCLGHFASDMSIQFKNNLVVELYFQGYFLPWSVEQFLD